jgi:hypothetical protein
MASVFKPITVTKVFTIAEFLRELDQKVQGLQLSGVGAHHQNGVTERAIKTTMERACTLMLHAAIHWPDVRDEQLCPWLSMIPFNSGTTPEGGVGLLLEELFTRSKGDGRLMFSILDYRMARSSLNGNLDLAAGSSLVSHLDIPVLLDSSVT